MTPANFLSSHLSHCLIQVELAQMNSQMAMIQQQEPSAFLSVATAHKTQTEGMLLSMIILTKYLSKPSNPL